MPEGQIGTGLVEREAELDLIAQTLVGVSGGIGRLVLFEADTGLGKSRLSAAAADLAEVTGIGVLKARGRELERDFPFGVATSLLERHLAGLHGDGVAALLTDHHNWRTPTGAGADRDEIVCETYRAIHGLFGLVRSLSVATGAPALAVIVDDVHYADPLSLRFLAYLAARISDLRVADDPHRGHERSRRRRAGPERVARCGRRRGGASTSTYGGRCRLSGALTRARRRRRVMRDLCSANPGQPPVSDRLARSGVPSW